MSKRDRTNPPPSPSEPSKARDEQAPRIYVACLASYNAGRLHGAWLEVESDEPLRCYACGDEATGLCDRRRERERGLVPACDRHTSHELAGAALEGARTLGARIQMEVLATSPEPMAEEVAIHDHEGFKGLHVGEYEPLSDVVAKARLVIEHGALGVAVAKHLGADHDIDRLHEVWTWMEDQYAGSYDSPQDWAASFLDETGGLGEVPASLRPYIDFEAYARDAELGGDVVFVRIEGEDWDGMIHVFHSA